MATVTENVVALLGVSPFVAGKVVALMERAVIEARDRCRDAIDQQLADVNSWTGASDTEETKEFATHRLNARDVVVVVVREAAEGD